MIDNSYADVGGSYDFGGFDDTGPSSFGSSSGSSPAPVADSFSSADSSGFAAPFDNSFVGPPAPAGLPAYSADEMAGDFAREQNRFTSLPSFTDTSGSASTTPYTGGADWAADVAARRSSLDWWTSPTAATLPPANTTPQSIQVQPGDSLSRIAGRLAGDGASAGSVNDLKNGFIAANPQLSNPNLLQAGQWLNVPRSDTVFDSAAFARATAADTQYLAAHQPAPAFSGFGGSSSGFGSGLGFGGPSFADLSAPSTALGSFGSFGSLGSSPAAAAAASPDALAQSRADMKAFYAQAQDNAVRDGNPFKYVGAHIASLAGEVGYDAAEGARGLFRLATDGNARAAAWNGLSNAVTQAVTHPGDTWDAGVRGVNHFLDLPFQEQADTVFKGGLGLLAGAGTARVGTAVGGLASQGLRSTAQWAIPTLERLDTLADAGAMATRRLPPSGNAAFDTLFADSPQASAMTAGLERRGVKLVDDVTALDPGEAAHVRLIDNQPHLFYDSGSTSLLDMLHESRHVAQIQRVQAADVLGDKSLFSTRLVGAAERGAYEYELRLGERFGFSDTYKNALREQVDKYYPSSLSIKFNSSDRMRAIFEAMEPGLKP